MVHNEGCPVVKGDLIRRVAGDLGELVNTLCFPFSVVAIGKVKGPSWCVFLLKVYIG